MTPTNRLLRAELSCKSEPARWPPVRTQIQPARTRRHVGRRPNRCSKRPRALRLHRHRDARLRTAHGLARSSRVDVSAVCDLYDSRHEAAQEAVKKQVPATRNYREILDNKDIDAVIVAVPDHQHRRMVVDAVAAGKDVY